MRFKSWYRRSIKRLNMHGIMIHVMKKNESINNLVVMFDWLVLRKYHIAEDLFYKYNVKICSNCGPVAQ